MKQVYVITKIEDSHIFAMQEKHLEGEGTKVHASLEVINPRKIKIHEGSKVYIGLSQKAEAFKGIISLFLPLLLCFLALIGSNAISGLLKLDNTENFKFICITIVFFVSASFVFFFSRNTPTIVKLQILSSAEK